MYFRTILCQTNAKLEKKVDRDAGEENPDLKLKEENPDHPGLSGLVRVVRDAARGRFAVAEQRIPPGTLIAVADPTVALLNPDNKELVQEHCLRCLKPCTSPHPCLSNVGRTSEICQQLLSLCSASGSSSELPTCRALLDKDDLDNLPEEQRVDLGLAVLEPSIGEALERDFEILVETSFVIE